MRLLPSKKTQKVNKQKFRCKNSRFLLVVCMSWTRYYRLEKNPGKKWIYILYAYGVYLLKSRILKSRHFEKATTLEYFKDKNSSSKQFHPQSSKTSKVSDLLFFLLPCLLLIAISNEIINNIKQIPKKSMVGY